MRCHLTLLVLILAVGAPATASAAAWAFHKATFSHDPETGEQVRQFVPVEPVYVRVDPTYEKSGYRHTRSSLRGADGSADRLHVVETWGRGRSIRPYGEWQFPFRAGATPYGPWGNSRGPWTSPFQSWSNPYGSWNRYPHMYPTPYAQQGHGGPRAALYDSGGPGPGYSPGPSPGHLPAYSPHGPSVAPGGVGHF
ncbi:MAG: hypothetical protein HQ581_12645 [Planctomycetes bacterium]|nr:hypothetical protein [Planctomycetota bacterium]